MFVQPSTLVRIGSRLALAVATWTVEIGGGGPAGAGEWTITPSLSLTETFTDNVSGATGENPRHKDLITTIAPGIAVRGRGARVSLSLDYSLLNSFYKREDERNRTQNQLAATGNAEVWEQIGFIDAQASISRQIVSSSGPVNSNEAGTSDVNRTNVRALNVSPYLLHHFGTWAETQSRLTLSRVETDTESVSNQSTVSERFTVNSGRRFSQTLWSLTVLNSNTTSEGTRADTSERRATRMSRTTR